jgi:hypothetical protein
MSFRGLFGDKFTFLYVDDIHTSQEKHMCFHGGYSGCFTFYMYMIFAPHRSTIIGLHVLLWG